MVSGLNEGEEGRGSAVSSRLLWVPNLIGKLSSSTCSLDVLSAMSAPPPDGLRNSTHVRLLLSYAVRLLRLPVAAAAVAAVLSWLATAAAATDDGTIFLRENVAYLDVTRRRLAVYRGPGEECAILANWGDVGRVMEAAANSSAGGGGSWAALPVGFSHLTYVSKGEMIGVLRQCQSIHAALYKTDPETFLSVRESAPEEHEPSSNEAAWDRMDNSLAIYKGLEKKRKRERQRNNSIWGWNFFNRILIMPGTKWCGQGDVAEHYHDLGYHREVDKCCRSVRDMRHPVCTAHIVRGERKKRGVGLV